MEELLLESGDLYKYVLGLSSEEINKNIETLINACLCNFDLIDFFTLMVLKKKCDSCDKIDYVLNNVVKPIFNNHSYIFLMLCFVKIYNANITDINSIYKLVSDKIKFKVTSEGSIILFDLCSFNDFYSFLYKNNPVVATLISAYRDFNPDAICDGLFSSSSIIDRLYLYDNESIAASYLKLLLGDEPISPDTIKMIGGGGTSLVYKIGDKVIKFGEQRSSRHAILNHRILPSLTRKLIVNGNHGSQFYVEIMKYIQTDEVTSDDVDELKNDLYRMGIIWDDAKIINCGIVTNPNDISMPIELKNVNLEEFSPYVDYPMYREAFMRRRKKVVVLDSDDMHLDYKRLWK